MRLPAKADVPEWGDDSRADGLYRKLARQPPVLCASAAGAAAPFRPHPCRVILFTQGNSKFMGKRCGAYFKSRS
jgi:hypothetical protein